jgi:hypothetical protein
MPFRFTLHHHMEKAVNTKRPSPNPGRKELQDKIAALICGVDGRRHDLIKSTFESFRAHTTIIGRMEDDQLLLGNCNACGSTLSVTFDMEREHYEALCKEKPRTEGTL